MRIKNLIDDKSYLQIYTIREKKIDLEKILKI